MNPDTNTVAQLLRQHTLTYKLFPTHTQHRSWTGPVRRWSPQTDQAVIAHMGSRAQFDEAA